MPAGLLADMLLQIPGLSAAARCCDTSVLRPRTGTDPLGRSWALLCVTTLRLLSAGLDCDILVKRFIVRVFNLAVIQTAVEEVFRSSACGKPAVSHCANTASNSHGLKVLLKGSYQSIKNKSAQCRNKLPL